MNAPATSSASSPPAHVPNIAPHSANKRSTSLGKIFLYMLPVVVIGIGLATWFAPRTPSGESVRVTLAAEREIRSRIPAQGKVRALRQIEVNSEVSGRVTAVHVKIGDEVDVGDPLFTVDGTTLKNGVQQLRTAVRAAETLVKRAKLASQEAERTLTRDQQLVDKGIAADDLLRASLARLELARADLDQAQANVDRARLDLERAQDNAAKVIARAPMKGIVVAVGLEVGANVSTVSGLSSDTSSLSGLAGFSSPSSSTSAPIIIADLSEIIAKLDVDELDVSQVKEGQPVEIKAEGAKDYLFLGVVKRVGLIGRDQSGATLFVVETTITGAHGIASSSSSIPSTASAPASVNTNTNPNTLNNPAQNSESAPVANVPAALLTTLLKPGMSISAEIEVEKLDKAIVAPVAAILEGDRAKRKPDRVFVAVDDPEAKAQNAENPSYLVEERVIKLGPSDKERIAILDGVKAGERIIEGPYRALRALKDKDSVQIEETVPLPGEETDEDLQKKETSSSRFGKKNDGKDQEK